MGQLVGIVLAGLTLRLALILAAGSRPQIFEYDGLARNLLSGQGYVYPHLGTLYRSYYSGVFYEWLAAAMYAMFPPGHTELLIAQSVVAALLVLVVFAIGRALAGPAVGLLAALLTSMHPALILW